MKGKIAVEPSLTPVKNYLAQKGYDVESVRLDKKTARDLRGYDALVVTGMHNDFLGIEDAQTKALVINADGLTPEDVARELDRIK